VRLQEKDGLTDGRGRPAMRLIRLATKLCCIPWASLSRRVWCKRSLCRQS